MQEKKTKKAKSAGGTGVRLAMKAVPAAIAAMLPLAAAVAEDEPLELGTMVVTASGVPVLAKEVGNAVTVISAEEIERKQTTFVSDVLRDVPGLAVSRSGGIGSATQVRIRGAEGNQTLVIIDGVEVNDPASSSEFDFGSLLAADIERIEILRGPQSALYGSDAIGGVINIITKSGEGRPKASISVEGGSFETAQISANVRGGGEAFTFSVGATHFQTEGYTIAPESLGNTEKDGHRNDTLNAKFSISPTENLTFDLSGRFVDSVVESDDQPAVAGIITTSDSNDELKRQEILGRAQMTYALFDGGWTHTVGVGINKKDADNYTNGAVTYESEGQKLRFDYETNIVFDTPSFADASHAITFLVEREDENQVTRSAFGNSDLEVTNYGYVGEYRLGLWDELFLSAGIRFDDNDLFKDATTYRGTAAYVFPETGTRLHTSIGTGVKNPTLTELYGFGPNFVPNANLKPETSTGWDIGVEQKLWGERITVDATYFNNEIDDLIQGSGNTAVNLSGTSRIRGVELTASARLTERLTLTGEYTYTDGKDANGAELVRRPRHMVGATLGYTSESGKLKMDLSVNYTGKRKDTQFSNFFGTQTVVNLDEYVLVDAGVSYEVRPGVELYGRVENLLDEDFQEVLYYDSPGLGAYVGVRFAL